MSNHNSVSLGRNVLDKHIWEYPEITLYLKEGASYSYSIKCVKTSMIPFTSRPKVQETDQRCFKDDKMYFDIFHGPENHSEDDENEGKVVFLQNRLKNTAVNHETMEEILRFCDAIRLFQSVSSLAIKQVEDIIERSMNANDLIPMKVLLLFSIVSKMVGLMTSAKTDFEYQTTLMNYTVRHCVKQLKVLKDIEHSLVENIAKIAKQLSIKLHRSTSPNLIDIVEDFVPFFPLSLLEQFEECSTEIGDRPRLIQLFQDLENFTQTDAILIGKMIIQKLRKVDDIQYLRKHMGHSKFSCDVNERLVQVLSEQIRSENELKGIYSLLTSHDELIKQSTNLAELVRQKTYKTLKESKCIYRSDYVTVIKHPGLFHTDQMRVDVMLTILERQELSSCDIVRHFLNDNQWMSLPEKDLKKVCTEWLKNKINVLESEKLSDIECYYLALEGILTTNCLTGKRGIQKYLSSLVLEKTQTHSTENLIEVLRNGDHLTETFSHHFRQILGERILSMNDSVSLLKSIVDKPFKNKR